MTAVYLRRRIIMVFRAPACDVVNNRRCDDVTPDYVARSRADLADESLRSFRVRYDQSLNKHNTASSSRLLVKYDYLVMCDAACRADIDSESVLSM